MKKWTTALENANAKVQRVLYEMKVMGQTEPTGMELLFIRCKLSNAIDDLRQAKRLLRRRAKK